MNTKSNPIACTLALSATLAAWSPLAVPSPLHAAELEMSKEIIAVQLRRQGYVCGTPLSATREGDATKFDDAVWLLKCNDATYKVQLIPNMAAKVERVPDAATDNVKSTSP